MPSSCSDGTTLRIVLMSKVGHNINHAVVLCPVAVVVRGHCLGFDVTVSVRSLPGAASIVVHQQGRVQRVER